MILGRDVDLGKAAVQLCGEGRMLPSSEGTRAVKSGRSRGCRAASRAVQAGRSEVVEPRRPNAKVTTCEEEEVPKRRTRRTHCGQSIGSLGARG